MTQRSLAIAVAVALAVLGALQLANPTVLGITPEFKAWAGILATGLGALAAFLPKVQGGDSPGSDPFTPAEVAVLRAALASRTVQDTRPEDAPLHRRTRG